MSKINELINKVNNLKITNEEVNHYDFSDYTKEEKEELKKELKKISSEKNTKQMALKIMMNSLYGAQANQYFPLFNRASAASITFLGRYIIKKTGDKVERELAKKLNVPVKEGQFLVYQDTDSCYFEMKDFTDKIFKKYFDNKSYSDLTHKEKEKFIHIVLKMVDKFIQPSVDETVKEIQDITNAFQKGFMGAKVEKINSSGIHIAKKRYALKTVWNEGKWLINKPKISVTGLEIVRSSTPDFCIDKLTEALLILMEKTEKELQDFIEETKDEFFKLCESSPEKISKTSSVNNLDYILDKKGWHRINEETGKRVPCPINSRAALIYNKAIIDNNLQEYYDEITTGDKIKYINLKMPNSVHSDIIGFKNEEVLKDLDLIKFIDKEKLFETNFIQSLKLLADAVSFELTKKSSASDWF